MKNNLGDYQTFTTIAKKVGGPTNLCIGIGAGGFALGGLIATVICWRKIKKLQKEVDASKDSTTYTVNTDCKFEDGSFLRAGSHFHVAARDGDTVLVDVLDDVNSPYYFSASLLSKISDYKD